jgi:hypothetical protein
MSSSEDCDDRLRRALQSLPLPEPPAALESRVQRRLRARRVRQAGTVAGVAVLLLAVAFAGPWGAKGEPGVPLPVAQAPREILADDLEVLFAPPPVDSLAVLDRRDAVSVAALNRLEGVK